MLVFRRLGLQTFSWQIEKTKPLQFAILDIVKSLVPDLEHRPIISLPRKKNNISYD